MLCVASPYTNPYFNLASEEFLLKCFQEDVFLLYRNAPSIVVGKHQNTLAEINLPFVQEQEILVELRVPVIKKGVGHGYSKLKRKTGDYAVAGSPVVIELDGDVCRDIRIALTNVAPMAIRAEAAENILRGQVIDDALIEQAAAEVLAVCDPAEDLRGVVLYKSHMGAEMARRSIRAALQQARG